MTLQRFAASRHGGRVYGSAASPTARDAEGEGRKVGIAENYRKCIYKTEKETISVRAK